jgi:hypothetical protein
MDNDNQTAAAQQPYESEASYKEKNMPDFEGYLRNKVNDMGMANGKATVLFSKEVDEDIKKINQEPSESFFVDLARRYESKANKYIKTLKDAAVKKGARPDAFKGIAEEEQYAAELQEKIAETQNNEFYGKNLVLYIIFAFLLCLGDILLGDYLAKEVLMAGKDASWKGILLGLFCIALGVILEIIINNLYTRKNKFFFHSIIVLIPIFTLFMFVGMGILRSSSVNLLSSASASGTILVPWTVTSFFIGMSLAAPTALGCVLFIIQKKVQLNSQIKRNRLLLEKTGMIINAGHLLEQNKIHLAKDLAAEYQIGFQKGKNEELFREPETPKAEEPLPGSIKDRLHNRLLKKYGFKTILIFVCGALQLSACLNTSKEEKGMANEHTCSIILLGLSNQDASKALQSSIAGRSTGTAFSVIWPGGIERYNSKETPGSSLLATTASERKTTTYNQEGLLNLQQRFQGIYQPINDTLLQSWRTYTLQLFALAAEHFQGRPLTKEIIFWLEKLPFELTGKTDSMIRMEAVADATTYKNDFFMNSGLLSGTKINIFIPYKTRPTLNSSELLRRTLLYYRELFIGFGAIVLTLKFITL